MQAQKKYLSKGIFAAVVILVADQLSKWAVFEKYLRQDGQGMDFAAWMMSTRPAADFLAAGDVYSDVAVTPFLNVIMVWNRGISFGLFAGDGLMGRMALVLLAAAITAVMCVVLYHASRRLTAVAAALVIGGAVGNIIDRLRFGAVADFVDVHFYGYHWPAFNLADSAIVIGALLLMIDTAMLKEETNPQHTVK